MMRIDKLSTWTYLEWRDYFVNFVQKNFKSPELIRDIDILNEGKGLCLQTIGKSDVSLVKNKIIKKMRIEKI